MIVAYSQSYALWTKLWCVWCKRLRVMTPVANRVWNAWRCDHCKRERPLALTGGTE